MRCIAAAILLLASAGGCSPAVRSLVVRTAATVLCVGFSNGSCPTCPPGCVVAARGQCDCR